MAVSLTSYRDELAQGAGIFEPPLPKRVPAAIVNQTYSSRNWVSL